MNETNQHTKVRRLRKKHGMWKTREYKVWKAIINRCFNKNHDGYHRYGGRGVTMCQRWRESFQAFFDDMGPRPSPKHSIERENNNGNYEPGNCRWATMSEQHRNYSQNVRLTKDGITMSMIEWSERLGIKYDTLRCRRNRGWSDAEVLQPLIFNRSNPAQAVAHYEPPGN